MSEIMTFLSQQSAEDVQQFVHQFLSTSPLLLLVPSICRTPYFILGRYKKLSRGVSQTPFFVEENDEEKKMEQRRIGRTSVEELIVHPLLERFPVASSSQSSAPGGCMNSNMGMSSGRFPNRRRGGEDVGRIVFSASGREDVDVRMLGNGRPFSLQVGNSVTVPTPQDISKIMDLINQSSDIEVCDLRIGSRTQVESEVSGDIEGKKKLLPSH